MMKYGVAYYPEHRTPEEFTNDLKLLKNAGLNIIRTGEFAWCKFEPREGQYDFEWMDDAIEKLGQAGIYTLICTPTAAPPVWMCKKYPEILYKDNRGVVRDFGARKHYCYNNPVYRDFSRKIAREIALRYKDNPYIVGFHIDNELAQESSGRCQCDICRGKFIEWLETKYKTIETLNEKMGTIFWGQTYSSFLQISPPYKTTELGGVDVHDMYFDNPSLRLEFERFSSDSIIEYQNLQLHEIKKHSDKPVTSNSTGFGTDSIDYYKAYKELDVYAYDIYPNLRGNEMSWPAFAHAFARGVKNKDFWIVELACGGGHALWGKQGWVQPYPGAIGQGAVHAFASGAELITHFQFATFPFGAEQLDGAVLDIDNIPRRRYFELKDTAADLKMLDDILKNSHIQNEVAICFDYDTLWALKIKPISWHFNYTAYCVKFHETLNEMGISADVIPMSEAINKYKLVIIPSPFLMKEEFKALLKDYVNNGGTLLTTFVAAVKDDSNVAIKESTPCGLTDLFGIRVGEVEPVINETNAEIRLTINGSSYTGQNGIWTELLEPMGAEIIGTYEDSFRKGGAVVSVNPFGKGKAYYLGTDLGNDQLKPLIEGISSDIGLRHRLFRPEKGIEIITREYKGEPVYFIFNFKQEPHELELSKPYQDVLGNKTIEEKVVIKPKGYTVLT